MEDHTNHLKDATLFILVICMVIVAISMTIMTIAHLRSGVDSDVKIVVKWDVDGETTEMVMKLA